MCVLLLMHLLCLLQIPQWNVINLTFFLNISCEIMDLLSAQAHHQILLVPTNKTVMKMRSCYNRDSSYGN